MAIVALRKRRLLGLLRLDRVDYILVLLFGLVLERIRHAKSRAIGFRSILNLLILLVCELLLHPLCLVLEKFRFKLAQLLSFPFHSLLRILRGLVLSLSSRRHLSPVLLHRLLLCCTLVDWTFGLRLLGQWRLYERLFLRLFLEASKDGISLFIRANCLELNLVQWLFTGRLTTDCRFAHDDPGRCLRLAPRLPLHPTPLHHSLAVV